MTMIVVEIVSKVIQIDETFSSESRVIEKSRMPEQESQRLTISGSRKQYAMDHEGEEEDDDFNADKLPEDRKSNKTYDMEVYDDRSFYSMLLKVRQTNDCCRCLM